MTALAEIIDKRERVAALGYDHQARAKVHISTCPVCSSLKRTGLANQDRYGFPAMFWQCDDCMACYLAPRMTKADYDDFYQSWYRPILTAWYGRPMDAEAIQEDQLKYGQRVLPQLAKHLVGRAGQTVLDVGGSTGVMAELMRHAYGLVPTVVDPSGPEVEEAREKGIDAIHGTLDKMPLWQQFDVITCFQTVEHFLEPIAELRRMGAMLKPGGVLIVDAVPFHAYLEAGMAQRMLKIDHPVYFCHGTMLKAIERSYLKLVQWYGIEGVRQRVYVCGKA